MKSILPHHLSTVTPWWAKRSLSGISISSSIHDNSSYNLCLAWPRALSQNSNWHWHEFSVLSTWSLYTFAFSNVCNVLDQAKPDQVKLLHVRVWGKTRITSDSLISSEGCDYLGIYGYWYMKWWQFYDFVQMMTIALGVLWYCNHTSGDALPVVRLDVQVSMLWAWALWHMQ